MAFVSNPSVLLTYLFSPIIFDIFEIWDMKFYLVSVFILSFWLHLFRRRKGPNTGGFLNDYDFMIDDSIFIYNIYIEFMIYIGLQRV